MVFCLFACALGAMLALTLPVGVFAVGLVGIAVLKAAVAMVMGAGVTSTLLWSVALFVCGQLGYVAGMAAQAAHDHRAARGHGHPEPRPSLRDPLLK